MLSIYQPILPESCSAFQSRCGGELSSGWTSNVAAMKTMFETCCIAELGSTTGECRWYGQQMFDGVDSIAFNIADHTDLCDLALSSLKSLAYPTPAPTRFIPLPQPLPAPVPSPAEPLKCKQLYATGFSCPLGFTRADEFMLCGRSNNAKYSEPCHSACCFLAPPPSPPPIPAVARPTPALPQSCVTFQSPCGGILSSALDQLVQMWRDPTDFNTADHTGLCDEVMNLFAAHSNLQLEVQVGNLLQSNSSHDEIIEDRAPNALALGATAGPPLLILTQAIADAMRTICGGSPIRELRED